MPEAVEITEQAVNRLGDIDRKVIKAYYLEWAPIEMLARKCRMREREFKNVLTRARFRCKVYVESLEMIAA
jgi:DNA-directed RNA polymerase specialized sigma24 family protein